jgi:hypothetical protein
VAALTQLDRIQRGREAAELLRHPLLVAAFAGVREGVIQQWEETPATDVRERLWAGLHGAKRIEAWLSAVVEDGTIAAHEAAQIEGDNV